MHGTRCAFLFAISFLCVCVHRVFAFRFKILLAACVETNRKETNGFSYDVAIFAFYVQYQNELKSIRMVFHRHSQMIVVCARLVFHRVASEINFFEF